MLTYSCFYSISSNTCSSSIVSPCFTLKALTTPVTPLAREFCIYIASTKAHSCPSPTLSPTLTDTNFTTPGIGERMTLAGVHRHFDSHAVQQGCSLNCQLPGSCCLVSCQHSASDHLASLSLSQPFFDLKCPENFKLSIAVTLLQLLLLAIGWHTLKFLGKQVAA